MRCEAKLCFLKNAGRSSNFKNIAQSVSYRHQHWICYELSSKGIFSPSLECGPTRMSITLSCQSSLIKDSIFSIIPGISNDVMVSYVAWVKKYGIIYRPGAYILYTVDAIDMVEQTLWFGLIEEILVIGSNLITFLIRKCKSLYYDDHFHAHIFAKTSEQCVIDCSSLLDPAVLHCRSIGDKYFINLKYYVNVCL